MEEINNGGIVTKSYFHKTLYSLYTTLMTDNRDLHKNSSWVSAIVPRAVGISTFLALYFAPILPAERSLLPFKGTGFLAGFLRGLGNARAVLATVAGLLVAEQTGRAISKASKQDELQDEKNIARSSVEDILRAHKSSSHVQNIRTNTKTWPTRER